MGAAPMLGGRKEISLNIWIFGFPLGGGIPLRDCSELFTCPWEIQRRFDLVTCEPCHSPQAPADGLEASLRELPAGGVASGCLPKSRGSLREKPQGNQ